MMERYQIVLIALMSAMFISGLTLSEYDINAASKKKVQIFIDDINGKNIDDLSSKSLAKEFKKIPGKNVTISIKEPGKSSAIVGIYTVSGNTPITCPAGYHIENGKCVKDTSPGPIFDSKLPVLNLTNTDRIGVVADTDCNEEAKKQLELFKKYNTTMVVLAGDFDYKENGCFWSILSDLGFNGNNVQVIAGNHDVKQYSKISSFNGENGLYYSENIGINTTMIAFNTGDSDTQTTALLVNGSSQFNFIKDELKSNTNEKVVSIHKPLVTAKSKHPNTGHFSLYHPLFVKNNVSAVLQGHNHNFQLFVIDGILYITAGTGTHDLGTNMYPITSQSDGQGHTAVKTIDNKNGIVLLDMDKNSKKIDGYFVGDDNTLLYKFHN